MNRWERFMFRRTPISRFSDEEGSIGEAALNFGRRSADTITPDMVKAKANNGQSVKELVAEVSLENKVEHAKINTTLSFHSKFIWTCIGLLVTAVVGGLVGLCFFGIRTLMERL